MNAFPVIKFLYSNIPVSSKKGVSDSAHEIITRLKFIGLILPEEKIDTRSMTSCPNTKLNALYRWWVQEDRSITLDFFTSTINRAFELIQLSIGKENDVELCKIIIEDLIKSPIGMINIQATYMKQYNNRIFWCDIQTLLQVVDLRLKKLSLHHPELFPSARVEIIDEPSTQS